MVVYFVFRSRRFHAQQETEQRFFQGALSKNFHTQGSVIEQVSKAKRQQLFHGESVQRRLDTTRCTAKIRIIFDNNRFKLITLKDYKFRISELGS